MGQQYRGGQGGGRFDDRPEFPKVTDQDLDIIMKNDAVESAKKTVEIGEKVGTASAKVSSSQIRVVFSKVRLIESKWALDDNSGLQHRELILLVSRLKYQAVRDNKLNDLVELLARAINRVNDRQTFQRFVDFFEAILAYHKVGGKQ